MGSAVRFQLALLRHVLINEGISEPPLPAAEAPGNLYLSLYTQMPRIGGSQMDNEVDYIGYARVALARDVRSWAFSLDEAKGAAIATLRHSIDFPECPGGPMVKAMNFGIGPKPAGPGILMYVGTLQQPLTIGIGRIPRLMSATRIIVH